MYNENFNSNNRKQGMPYLLFVIFIIAMPFVFLFAVRIPSYDENIIFYMIFRSIIMLLIGCGSIIYVLFKLKKYKTTDTNSYTEKNRELKRIVSFSLVGIVFLFLGLFHSFNSIADAVEGPNEVILYSTQCKYHERSGKYGSAYYTITGKDTENENEYQFRLSKMSKSNVTSINDFFTNVKIVYYPRTKAIKSLEIITLQDALEKP